MTEPMTSRLLIAAPHGVAMKLRDILATAQIVPSAVLSTGGEALAALEDEQALLLTSWRLPDMTGAELARKADAAGVDIPDQQRSQKRRQKDKGGAVSGTGMFHKGSSCTGADASGLVIILFLRATA